MVNKPLTLWVSSVSKLDENWCTRSNQSIDLTDSDTEGWEDNSWQHIEQSAWTLLKEKTHYPFETVFSLGWRVWCSIKPFWDSTEPKWDQIYFFPTHYHNKHVVSTKSSVSQIRLITRLQPKSPNLQKSWREPWFKREFKYGSHSAYYPPDTTDRWKVWSRRITKWLLTPIVSTLDRKYLNCSIGMIYCCTIGIASNLPPQVNQLGLHTKSVHQH